MNPETRNWLASAEYDLDTAQQMLDSGRYIYVVFMCHLAVEKTLKALICESTKEAPPRSHDLPRLASLAKVALRPDLAQFIAQLTDASVSARYPDDLGEMVSRYPRQVSEDYLARTREVISWLRADPRLQP